MNEYVPKTGLPILSDKAIKPAPCPINSRYVLSKDIIEKWFSNPLASGKGRNLTCPCGSKKKAKKCCGLKPFVKEYLYIKLKVYVEGASGLERKTLEAVMQKELELLNRLRQEGE